MNTQTVYFDPDDEAMDGYGWNVVDTNTDTGVAARFATEAEAIDFCETLGFIISTVDAGRDSASAPLTRYAPEFAAKYGFGGWDDPRPTSTCLHCHGTGKCDDHNECGFCYPDEENPD